MAKQRSKVRKESILRIPQMTLQEKDNIRRRIFNNDDITSAGANVMSRHASSEQKRAKFQLDRAHSVIDGYRKSVASIDSRMMLQFHKLCP